MHRLTKRLIAAAVVVGALAAGGAAFTANNVMPAGSTAGYGTVSVTGATMTDVVYGLNGPGTQITGATLTFTGDIHTDTVKAGFEANDLLTCTGGTYSSPSTTFTCSGFTEPTGTSSTFNVAVTNN